MVLASQSMLVLSLKLMFLLGNLAQTIGLCMVRGVNEFKRGHPRFLIAILLSGAYSWFAAFFALYFDFPVHYKVYSANIWIVLGGLLFGLGTAFNQGYGVSTLSKLSRGDLKMIATITGWLTGWIVLAQLPVSYRATQLPLPSMTSYLVLLPLSIVLSIWTLMGDSKRKQLWFGMMVIGLLAGFLFLLSPSWPPSGLLNDLSGALLNVKDKVMPSPSRFLMFVLLIMGMIVAAWRTKRFSLVKPNIKQVTIHLIAGVLMGLGASLAMGGNDSQLLLALPAFSPAGFVAVSSMLIGIAIGLNIFEKLRI